MSKHLVWAYNWFCKAEAAHSAELKRSYMRLMWDHLLDAAFEGAL